MKKSVIKLAILLSSSLTLFGCGENNSGNEEKDIQVNNIQTGLEYLYYNHNYTFTYLGTSSDAHEIKFTRNALGLTSKSAKEATNVYVNSEYGVYSINYDDGKYVASEIIEKDADIWNGNYYSPMYHKGNKIHELVSPDAVTYNVADKEFKLNYLKMLGYQASTYVQLNRLSVSFVKDEGLPVLTFALEFNSATVKYELHDFGTTTIDAVNEYQGSYFVPTKEMNKLKKSFLRNNYAQKVYEFTETGGSYTMMQYFHPHYFISQYNSAPNYLSGAIALNSAETEEHPALYGCYYFSITNGVPSLNNMAVYSKPDIVSFYHYPSLLKLWDNMHYLHSWKSTDTFGDYSKQGGASYVLTNYDMLVDFASNFSLSDNIPGHTPVALGIDIIGINAMKPQDFIVNLYYKFIFSNYLYVLPIPFGQFGLVNNATLDQIYAAYND